jgi:hypothetical protein
MMRRAPRARASSDFTRRVMARVGQAGSTRPPIVWRPAFAVAALVVISILSGVAFENHREAERLEALRIEARQLEAELEALKKQSAESSEVYLGGDGNREYVLDLRDLTAPSSQVQPVSHSY